MFVTKRDGQKEPLNTAKYNKYIDWMCLDLEGVSSKELKSRANQSFYDGMSTKDICNHTTKIAMELISLDAPNWTYAASRALLHDLIKEVTGDINYLSFESYLTLGVEAKKLNAKLLTHYSLSRLEAAIVPSRDFKFDYLGLQTIADRYLVRTSKLIELPQHFFMRVACGICLAEPAEIATDKAIELYNVYSTFKALSSTPTLFNSGTLYPQLSSCFGINMADSLDGIYSAAKEAATYSKFSGGVAVDVSDIRASGSHITSTGGRAGGPVPYIKIIEDSLIGFDQSGKRKGSGVIYLETWHSNIKDFLKLRDPGDHRLRAHDTFMASWIPDLFMERLLDQGYWSLFDPKDVPDLHTSFGEEFKTKYEEYEAKGLAKSVIEAEDLWNLILTALSKHGVFWPCFKDTINLRYPQRDTGPVLSSNLCTEICLRSDETTSFVCNLSSINLSEIDGLVYDKKTKKLSWSAALEHVVRILVRTLDNVITVGLIPHENGRRFQEEDRAVGLGIMGWTDALYKLGIDYESADHVHFSNEVYKQISISSIHESSRLAVEKGVFPNFKDSDWAKGILPHQTLRHTLVVDKFKLDINTACPWITFAELSEVVKTQGMRNSVLLAIAPTATIANILGCSPCTEINWDVVSTKTNLSGNFKVFSRAAVLNKYNLSIKPARDYDQLWTIWSAAARQIWIDQSQSTNIYINPAKFSYSDEENERTGKKLLGDYLDELYCTAWQAGLKTTYYLYSQSNSSKLVPDKPGLLVENIKTEESDEQQGKFCAIDAGPDCEACQ
jgi:ribonucleoside-diphosphate reductase alpha chain